MRAGALPAPELDRLIKEVNKLDMVEVHRQVAKAQQQADAQATLAE